MTTLAASTLGPHTLAEWLEADQPEDGSRLELLAGWWLVTPAAGGPHQYAGDELRTALAAALREAGRNDPVAVTAVGTDLSALRRDGLIPDVVVCTRPLATVTGAEQLRLVVEVWSPGNTARERAGRRAAYAAAGVPFFWEVRLDAGGATELLASRLRDGYYEPVSTVRLGDGPVVVTAAPAPTSVDVARLRA